MPLQTTQKHSKNLPPSKIIQMGEDLAALETFQAQENFFQSYIQDYFDAAGYIWLNTLPRSFIIQKNLQDFPFDPRAIKIADEEESKGFALVNIDKVSWLICPLHHADSEFGKVILHREHPFDTDELEIIKTVCKVASLAFYASLQSSLQNWRQKQLALVRSVSAQISQITDLDILTRRITKLVQQTFNYEYVAVFTINEDSQRLHFKASAGADEDDRPEFERGTHPGFELGQHMIGYVAQTGQELVANDVTQEPRYKKINSLAQTRSEVVLPLKVETRVYGVFDVQSIEQDAFNEDDLLVLRALADNIAIAVESTQLYKGIQTRADQLSAVSEVSRAITYILDIDELLQKIVDLIRERFGYPFVHLYTIDPVQRKITFKAGSGERTQHYARMEVSYDLDAEKGVLTWTVNHGKTRRINDVTEDPLFLESPIALGSSGSEMAVPLFFGGNVLGVLDIQSENKNAFSQDDQQLMETLGDNIAIAIRNARLYHSERWRRQIAENLRDIAGLLSENTELTDVLDEILSSLMQSLPVDVAGIWLLDPDSPKDALLEDRRMVLAAYQTAEGILKEELGDLSFVPDAWVKKALLQKSPSIRQPGESIGPIAKQFNYPQDYSSISAPMQIGNETLGMLTLVHHSPHRYGQESEKITFTFANYAAVAIKNQRLYTSTQEQAWISTILLQVANATQSLNTLDELVTTIVRLTPMVAGVKGCGLLLREPESDTFSLYAAYGLGGPAANLALTSPLPLPDAPILEELLLTKDLLKVGNPKEDLDLPDDLAEKITEESLILLPLISRDEILGAFLLANEADPAMKDKNTAAFNNEMYKILQGIAQQTAIAVENIRLLESKQEDAYISTVLLQVAQAVVGSADLQDTLESIIQIMPILVGIDSSVIYLWDEVEQQFITSHATSKGISDEAELLEMHYDPGDFPMLDQVFMNNRPIAYPFVENTLPPEDWDLVLPDEGQIDPTPVLQSRYPLLMGFPLSVKDEVFGVLLAEDDNAASNRERRFELLWGIAQQTSLAIQNDVLNKEMLDRQRLEREFQLAREIQQTFLPNQVPEIPGWEMDVQWDTARQVGGDFYDYFLLPDGRLAFVIADVSDKGLAASLYMTVTRTLLRAAALETASPAKTLERVNDLLLVNSQNGLFVTTFYGILSLEDGYLSYTIAGHNPPLILRSASHQVVELEKGGIAIGALPDIHLDEQHVKLGFGDCILLYTDGVTEAFNNADQMYGLGHLKQVLQTVIGKGAHVIIETLVNDLEAFRNGIPLSDDTTILAICRSGSLANENRDIRSAENSIDSTAE